jgi:xylose isomerase
MSTRMFENQLFDHWLQQKSQEILSKMDKEKVTTEDMLILTLKAQTNHFHHMDVEFREEFKKIDTRFDKLEKKFDQRLDRMNTLLMWGFGLIFTSMLGLFIKTFLG